MEPFLSVAIERGQNRGAKAGTPCTDRKALQGTGSCDSSQGPRSRRAFRGMNGVTAVNIRLNLLRLLLPILAAACSGTASSPPPQSRLPPSSGLDKVNHIIVVMMENHSFDNYF